MRQHDDEAERVASEEPVAGDRERRQRAQQHGDDRRPDGRLRRVTSSASRAPALCQAFPHQSRVKPSGGQASDVAVLNEKIATIRIGA